MDPVEAWRKWKEATRELRAALLDANHFRRFEAIVQDEVETLVRETADDWDDKNRFRMLLTRFGLDPILEFAHTAVSKALRKYLGPP